ncbi:DNA-binding response regulator [Pseudoflavonifractor sp. 60]|uniref:response regulator transcription factor n=1 Tax=Pseudoflavonifractor sp. 60 TaxID=2304576 RepID=UPI0013708846|nr:response regulator transcription factor [Pseudoflavonifractor sp. 60]NBI68840.1 DNA-binding response regulator [Pseudoflavonifractor sp. 60]
MKTIAVIDDDIHIGNVLEELLQREGYAVLRAYSGTEALLLLERRRPDLVLLDLMMPGLPGEEVLAKIHGIPVIVVSAKAGIEDKVALLCQGAADYVTKPFDSRELLARVAARLRESAASGLPPALEAGPLRMDQTARAVTANGLPVHLTKTEYAILKLFLQNPGQAMAKSVILDRISADTPDCTESSLKIHVSNLRRKLRDALGEDCIESVWGIGFKLNLS